jgi:hypothetical protein
MIEKFKINLIGGGFSHHPQCSSALNKNKYVEWVLDKSSNISVHVDESIFNNVDKSKFNVAWLSESSSIIPKIIDNVKNNLNGVLDNFNMFMTHDLRLLEISEKFVFVPTNALPWIQNRKIFNKNKNISMIASNKIFCKGHEFRQEIIRKYFDVVDHFGRGFGDKELSWTYKDENGNEESGKMLALKDYRFSIAMENDNYDTIFCEKITDCFATGTIPIFWGSKKIVDFFNKDGIIFLEDFNPEMCTEDFYHSKMEAIKDNLELVKNMLSAEDYFYLNYLK